MAELGKNSRFETLLNGQITDSIEDLNDLKLNLLFDNGNIQADLSTSEQVSIVLDGYDTVMNWKEDGNTYEGLPLTLREYNENNSLTTFDGYIDLSDGLEIDTYRHSVKCNIKKDDGIELLSKQITGISYGYLESIGVFNQSDYKTIEYVVERKSYAFEILVSTMIEISMLIQLGQQIEKTGKDIDIALSLEATASLGSTLAAAFYTTAVAILDVAFATLMVSNIITLGTKLINTFVVPKRTAKAISLYKMVYNVIVHLGYEFEMESSCKQELQSVYYLPLNNQLDEFNPLGFLSKVHGTESGVPSIEDAHYFVKAGFDLVKKVINGKYAILDGVVHLRNIHDDFWIKKSTYVMGAKDDMPQLIPKLNNANELKKGKLFKFLTDITDEWTIDNYTGTSYAINVSAINYTDIDRITLTGLDETIFDCSLGNRKDKLNAFEKVLSEVAGVVDGAINTFGGNGRLQSKIKNKVNLLKISDNNYANAKLLKYTGDKLVDRDLFSAKYLYEKYYDKDSFVANDFYGQKSIYNGITIPLGFDDVVSLINNSYFYTISGELGKFTSIEYDKSKNNAVASFWIREKYTEKLKETKIEV